jgi:hypothetical protein
MNLLHVKTLKDHKGRKYGETKKKLNFYSSQASLFERLLQAFI